MKKLSNAILCVIIANFASVAHAVGTGFVAAPSSAVMINERNSGNQFGNNNDQVIGSSQNLGTQTKYYNNNGQMVGSAQTSSNGSTYYYNQNGQIVGYSLK